MQRKKQTLYASNVVTLEGGRCVNFLRVNPEEEIPKSGQCHFIKTDSFISIHKVKLRDFLY